MHSRLRKRTDMGCCSLSPRGYVTVRCHHCGDTYDIEFAPKDYCPGCEKVVREALSHVPRKWVYGFWPVNEPTFEVAHGWQKEQARDRDERRARGELVSKKVAAPLFDMEDNSNINNIEYVRGQGEHQGIEFLVSSWSKRGESTVSRRCWKNTVTGEMRDK